MKLRWLPKATEDLREVHDYLYLNSSQLAQRIVNEIYNAILLLRQTPYMGRPNHHSNTRDLILPRIRYKVTYRIREEAVEILYIRHSSRDPRIN